MIEVGTLQAFVARCLAVLDILHEADEARRHEDG